MRPVPALSAVATLVRAVKAAVPVPFALAALLLAVQTPVPAWAQRASGGAPLSLLGADTARTPPALRGLRWRLVGPFRGGRVDAVAGDPSDPRVFYFGAVDGGVWKTENAGETWRNVTDGKTSLASVGAVAVAPSDPNVVYAGGGESDPREDITYGTGMYRSTDGGATWTHLGLEDTRHIAAIRVDPGDPDRVWVAALGHAFGPNPERGVYRTTDGGKSWRRVLFVNDSTGAIDLALDPKNPRVLYAAMWKFERMPWGFSAGGGRSGLWKSTDGGDTWGELSSVPGLPDAPLGRIGVAVSPVDPSVVYASVEAADSAGGIFRSRDGGATWRRMNADQKFMIRPWYFSAVTADPGDVNTVWVMNLGTWRSIDGGRTFERVRTPHGDCHILWIDPADPDRMIEGNDGGATISLDGGETWSTQGNQPTAQFYHVTTDDQLPYRIYGAQQDNSTVSIASRSDAGAITTSDWYSVGGGESGYIAPKPDDPSTVFAGSYMGTITRYDHHTHSDFDVSSWLNNSDGYTSAQVKYRFQWTFPIVFAAHDPNTLYATSQYVHRTTDGGRSWSVISPDLTRHDTATMGPVGGPITLDMTGTEWYATIFAFAPSPVDGNVLWAGSDDGLVHVSRDGGAHWADATPRDMPAFTRVSIIEPGHHDAGTAYAAANRYQLDDFRPYLWKTTDFGRTWKRIDAGIPVGAYTRAIREDPVRSGLLFAGTETGVRVSFDDGAHWAPLQLNLPQASVRDLAVHGNDLIAATHGRAFWVLDDITPLREWSAAVAAEPAHLFAPAPAMLYAGRGRGRARGAGENPPYGAIIDYALGKAPAHEVRLEVLDSAGQVVRRFPAGGGRATAAVAAEKAAAGGRTPGGVAADTLKASATRPNARPRIEHDSLAFEPADSVPSRRVGLNRFVWDLRTPDAKGVKGIVEDEGMLTGPLVLPGTYSVRLTVDGASETRPLVVRPDPRVAATAADLAAQRRLALGIHDAIDSVSAAVGRIGAIETQLHHWTEATKGRPYAARVDSAATAVTDTLEALRGALVCVHCHAGESTLAYPIQLYNKLLSLNQMVLSAQAAPTTQDGEVFGELSAVLQRRLAALRALEGGPVASFNALLASVGAAGVIVR